MGKRMSEDTGVGLCEREGADERISGTAVVTLVVTIDADIASAIPIAFAAVDKLPESESVSSGVATDPGGERLSSDWAWTMELDELEIDPPSGTCKEALGLRASSTDLGKEGATGVLS